MFEYDLVVIGVGRVGLPLSLSFANEGLKVIGIDTNDKLIEKIDEKIMPFKEPNYEDILKNVDFKVYKDYSWVSKSEHIIITVGTPLLANIETDLSGISKVMDSIIPYLKEGQIIILRSTVASRTTEFVKRKIELKTKFRIGEDLFLAYCPERLVEGKAFEELKSLPQIIGTEDDKSAEKAEQLFKKLSPCTIRTDFCSAELVKLFNNVSRYVYFAISNSFAIIAQEHGKDVYDILHMSNYKYPRPILTQPGFTAGTCLRKDFGMIDENIPHADIFINAWKVNEFMPKSMVLEVLKRTEINGKVIGVLGYTFKRDSDDTRDSLAPKLIRYIQREVPKQVLICEPHLGSNLDGIYENHFVEKVARESDIIFVATNHTTFKDNFKDIIEMTKPGCLFADIWNISGKNKMIFTKEEILEKYGHK